MPYKLGVLVIHGMGSQEADFVAPMVEELKRRVRELGGDETEIAFEAAWWAPVLRARETILLSRMERGTDLDWMELRRFVVHALTDAIAYQDTNDRTGRNQINVYHEVHDRIAAAVKTLRTRIRHGAPGDAPEAPLVVVAHSLGCHMISNYIWDVRDSDHPTPAGNPFEDFRTLAGIVMLGCNIPLFTLAYTRLEPIRFPTPGLARWFRDGTSEQAVADVSKWLNFYDPDDVLGYPLRSLDDTFAQRVSEDIAVDAGGALSGWNPLSHNRYWTDDDVTTRVARLLHGILRLL